MKKTIILAAFAILSITVSAQPKQESKQAPKAVSDTTVKVKTSTHGDTLTVEKAKFIKIGNRVWPAEILEKMYVPMMQEDIQTILNVVQEYPAKTANPLTEWLLRFFGIETKKK